MLIMGLPFNSRPEVRVFDGHTHMETVLHRFKGDFTKERTSRVDRGYSQRSSTEQRIVQAEPTHT